MSKAKVEDLPHGAIGRVAEKSGYSRSLVAAVARGERRNVLVEELLWMEKRDYQAKMRRIERLKEEMKKHRFGEIDTSSR